MSGQNVSTAVMQRRHVTVDKLDYYPTPPWATRAFMLEVLRAHECPRRFERIWEPACGEGHMAWVLEEFSDEVLASDVHDYGRGHAVGSFVGEGLDVMPSWPTCDWIITNPPFNLALEFAHRASRRRSMVSRSWSARPGSKVSNATSACLLRTRPRRSSTTPSGCRWSPGATIRRRARPRPTRGSSGSVMPIAGPMPGLRLGRRIGISVSMMFGGGPREADRRS